MAVTSWQPGIRIALLLILVVMWLPGGALADEVQQVGVPAGGTELFRALLDRSGLKPVTRDEYNRMVRFDDLIVIVLGDPEVERNRLFQIDPRHIIERALSNGGAVLVATDTDLALGFAFRPNGQASASIVGIRVECLNTKATLENRRNCPFVVPIPPQDPRLGDLVPTTTALGKLFHGDEQSGLRPLRRVATNHPAAIHVTDFVGHFRFPLARYPRNCVISRDDGQQFLLPDTALFAIGGFGPEDDNFTPYNYLALADHSVFINQMLLEPNTDNLELTYRVIDYLRKPNPLNPRDSTRKRCLFIENGRIVERFDELRQAFKQQMPLPQVNLWAIQDKLVDLGNAIIDDVQNRDVPNKLVVGGFGLPGILRFLVLLLTLIALWFILQRMFASRKPTDLPPALKVPSASTGPPGVFDRRQRELLRRNNLYEPVRDLLRDFFTRATIGGEPGPKPPKLHISNSVRKPESLRTAIHDFWKLAFGPPTVVTIKRWREMEPYFERLQQAHADGQWWFAAEQAPAGSVV
jgi:hypothetical protein